MTFPSPNLNAMTFSGEAALLEISTFTQMEIKEKNSTVSEATATQKSSFGRRNVRRGSSHMKRQW